MASKKHRKKLANTTPREKLAWEVKQRKIFKVLTDTPTDTGDLDTMPAFRKWQIKQINFLDEENRLVIIMKDGYYPPLQQRSDVTEKRNIIYSYFVKPVDIEIVSNRFGETSYTLKPKNSYFC